MFDLNFLISRFLFRWLFNASMTRRLLVNELKRFRELLKIVFVFGQQWKQMSSMFIHNSETQKPSQVESLNAFQIRFSELAGVQHRCSVPMLFNAEFSVFSKQTAVAVRPCASKETSVLKTYKVRAKMDPRKDVDDGSSFLPGLFADYLLKKLCR